MTDDLQKFPPLNPNHWAIGTLCSACKNPFKAGEATTLVSLGPGDNPEERRKCFAGRAYNAVAAHVHWECAAGSPE